MGALWELGEATVTQVRERLDPGLAYTSVSTVLRLLEMKGMVGHRRGSGKTHVYHPLVDAETAGGSVLDRVLARVYRGSPVRLLAHLITRESVTEDDLRRMRELLDAAEGDPR